MQAFAALSLMATTLAAMPAAGDECKLAREAVLPVIVDQGRLIVSGAVNNQSLRLKVATGTPYSWIMQDSADRLALPRIQDHLVTKRELKGGRAGGPRTLYVATIDELALGAPAVWRARDLELPLLDLSNPSDPPNYDGILGANFWSGYDLEFDLAHNRLTLFKPQHCEDTALAYWDGGFEEMDFDSAHKDSTLPWLGVTINGTPLRAILSSDSNVSILTREAAARLGVTADSPGAKPTGSTHAVGDDLTEDFVAPFDAFSIAGESIKHTRLRVGDIYGIRGAENRHSLPDMVLGLDFLTAHRVMLSYGQRKIYFSYIGGPVFQLTGPRRAYSSVEGNASDERQKKDAPYPP
ncbi:aspartyl protease family protein [Nitrospirillum sp. BR 11828]|uniref:aspartyl protease family protein n=1 Tax=Nitrospirillum sp. BR 11828 TaxID=3104325 RepID=UPI002ACAF68E|nr:aspartyl protease family protein [Nitrospirillum sp. BR 11828]MDZ5649088.1 aspartyl protease family protein [Nitrospirillum sp. BR 11828]